MPPFNPDLNRQSPQDPNYLGYSKGIEQPKPDVSTATFLKGIGEVFDTSIKGVDSLIKEDIKNQVYSKVDAERGGYTNALIDRKNAAGAPGVISDSPYPVDPNSPEATDFSSVDKPKANEENALNLLPTTEQPPAGVDRVGAYAENLQSAYASGKISNSYYMMRLDQVAVEMRNRYPGYREYIDQQISRVTGVTPANARVSALMRDINAAQGAGAKLQTRALSLIEKHSGEADAPAVSSLFQAGKIGYQDVFTWSSKYDFEKARLAKEKQERDVRKEKNEDSDQTDQRNATRVARGETLNAISAIKFAGGIYTPEQMTGLLTDHLTGKKTLQQQDVLALGQALTALETTLPLRLKKKFSEQGYGFDGKVENEIIDQQVKAVTAMREMAGAKRLDAISSVDNRIKAVSDDTTSAMFADKTMNSYLAMMKAVQGLGPQVAEKVFSSFIVQKPEVVQGMKSFVEHHKLESLTQPSIVQTGKPSTFRGALNDAAKHDIKSPEVYAQFVDGIRLFTDPKVPDVNKENVAKWYFDPSNGTVLDRFQKEYLDANGKKVPGRFSVFSRLVNDKVSSQVKKLSTDNPSLWRDYVSFADNNFGNVLLRQAIKDLNTTPVVPNISLSWDSEKAEWKILGEPDRPGGPLGRAGFRTDPVQRRAFEYMKSYVDDINLGLQGMKSIAKAEGKDMNAYVLDKLIQFGFEPRTQGMLGIPDKQRFGYDSKTSILQQLGGSVMASQIGPESPQDAPTSRKTEQPRGSEGQNTPSTEIANFAPNDIFAPTLTEWLADPAREKPKQLILDRKTGKYVPYEDKTTTTKDKVQDRVKK